MKLLSTRAHGVVDYLVGILLIAAPFLLNFYRGGAESWVPIFLGIGVILYSLVTDYELSIAKVLPMPNHLWLDALGGMILEVSPWMLNFADYVWVPHVVVGILEIATAAITERRPSFQHRIARTV